jgi:predicted membrane channel-forming protein YqfA (hemolysin III family)
MFKWHNETMSIWTHLLAALYFIWQLFEAISMWKEYGTMDFKLKSFRKYGLEDKIANEGNFTVFA